MPGCCRCSSRCWRASTISSLATVGLIALAYSGMGSISQPLFGWLADRHGTRLIGAALIWTAVTFAGIGFAPSFPLILVLAGLAGIGSGAFHPFGALNANAVITPGKRNAAMSVYASGGTLGFAIGPLIGVALLALLGQRGLASDADSRHSDRPMAAV